MSSVAKFDGRWLTVGLLLIYYASLFSAGAGAPMTQRWRAFGVYADQASFLDLRLFPAARATVAAGGELYGPSPTDPMQRCYNYPRAWLIFMRFPGGDAWIRTIGCLLAAAALAAILFFCGPLSTGEGFVSGLLLCSPAIQLGVERGNTDQAILAIVAASIWFAATGKSWRLAAGLLWGASILKLFPILVFGAWFDGRWRAWLKKAWVPLILFAAYLILTREDIDLILRNTRVIWGSWVQSYGALTLAAAATQVLAFHGKNGAEASPLIWAGRIISVAGVGLMFLRGWLQPRLSTGTDLAPPIRRAMLGFRAGALIYIGTFISGSNYDYRLCFLLLTLPQLFVWRRLEGALPRVALGSLFFSVGINYVIAGWPGFFINEAARWALLLVLAALLGQSYSLKPRPA